MRLSPSFFVLFALLALFSSLAYSSNPTAVNSVMADYLQPGETYTKTLHEIGGADYYLVSINDTPSMIFAESNGNVQLISNETEIFHLLLQELAENNVSPTEYLPNATELDEIWGHILTFNESRDSEVECETLIGIDRFPCYDLETCWRACYTPACQTMKIGSGEFFLGLVKEMYLNTTFIDGNMSEFNKTLRALSADDPELMGKFDMLLANIQNMRDSGGKMGENLIQDAAAIGFCFPIRYDYTGLIDASAHIVRVRDNLAPLFSADDMASLLANRTRERMAIRDSQLGRAACVWVRADAKLELDGVTAQANRALAVVSSPDLLANARALDSMYTGLNCSTQTLQSIGEFNRSFFSLAANLSSASGQEFGVYEQVVSKLQEAKSTLSVLQARAPNDARVQQYAATVSEFEATIRALPNPSTLDSLNAQLDGNVSKMKELEATLGSSPFSFQALVFVVILIALVGAAAIFLTIGKKKKKRSL